MKEIILTSFQEKLSGAQYEVSRMYKFKNIW